MKLKNRIAIITGAARGIGLACAERFVAEGAHVMIADVLDEVGTAEARRLGAAYLHCDVSKSSDVNATVAAVVKKYGAVDILMNNAAINISGDFLDPSEADFDRVIAINLKSSCATALAVCFSLGKTVWFCSMPYVSFAAAASNWLPQPMRNFQTACGGSAPIRRRRRR